MLTTVRAVHEGCANVPPPHNEQVRDRLVQNDKHFQYKFIGSHIFVAVYKIYRPISKNIIHLQSKNELTK